MDTMLAGILDDFCNSEDNRLAKRALCDWLEETNPNPTQVRARRRLLHTAVRVVEAYSQRLNGDWPFAALSRPGRRTLYYYNQRGGRHLATLTPLLRDPAAGLPTLHAAANSVINGQKVASQDWLIWAVEDLF